MTRTLPIAGPAKLLCLSLTLFCLSTSLCFGQNARVTGAITDPAGAFVPEAAITATNIETGEKHSAVTNSEGYYTLASLDPGRYRIEVAARGFRGVLARSEAVEVQS